MMYMHNTCITEVLPIDYSVYTCTRDHEVGV